MTMQNSSNKPGKKNKMVSKKFDELSTDDLCYLEKILGEKFAQQLEADQTWAAKNHYDRPGNKKKQILRIMDAVRSQKRLTSVAKW